MSRSYRSIGDVLTLLRGEFPDITISKIRFLESQGLVSPQRSPSGYRKFYDEDIERLRYVLVQQREHFLPLKVIRDRLNGVESDEDTGAGDPVPGAIHTPVPAEVPQASTEPAARRPAPSPVKKAPAATTAQGPTVADVLAALQEAPVGKPEPVRAVAPPAVPTPPAATPRKKATSTMTVEEVCADTGLTEAELDSLVSYGILHQTDVAGLTCFDDRAVEIARLATGFLSLGAEARHLKLFRNSVDREMGLVEQIVTPMLRQRNPESRGRAEATVAELARLGGELRGAMMATQLDTLLGR
jgi:DNA-binding transcriptional MerR regulator